MKVKYREIEDAFDFVSYGMEGDHSAVLDKVSKSSFLKLSFISSIKVSES